MTWQVTYVESAIPRTTGTVDSGTLTQETMLPTNKLNQYAFRLNGASLDASRPARIFIGFGVAGGTIPGKEIQFGGIFGQAAVPDTRFPYYPFIGFSSIETNLANVVGTYSHLGFDEVPSQNFCARLDRREDHDQRGRRLGSRGVEVEVDHQLRRDVVQVLIGRRTGNG